MKIYALNSRLQLPEALYQECLSWIAPDYRERIRRYRFWEDQQRSLFGHVMVRYAIMKNFNLNNNDIVIMKNSYGKPYLHGYHDIHFNISHSKDWVVCVINTSAVGIDVQEIKDVKSAIADRFFTKEENDYLASLELEARLQGFYEIWSLKEAYIKALGFGLSLPLNEFSIIKSLDNIKVKSKKDKEFYFKQYNFEEGYKLSVCSKENNFCNTINNLEINKILIAF